MSGTMNGSVLPPEYDEIQPKGYDPAFTAGINTMMRIPDKLGASSEAVNGGMSTGTGYGSDMTASVDSRDMTVPEKIVIAGQNQHIGTRPEVNLEPDFIAPSVASSSDYVGLSAPPSVLTVDTEPPLSNHLPSYVDEDRPGSDSGYPDSQHGYATPPRVQSQTMLPLDVAPASSALLLTGDDQTDMITMQRQVNKLSRQINHLTEDNHRRNQRELLLYPVILGYFLFKVASWLLRSGR